MTPVPQPKPDDPRVEKIQQALGDAFYDNNHTQSALAALDGLAADTFTLRKALKRATYIAENLHMMIDRDTWRASGGDDGQGHYEGDYRAEQLHVEIKQLAALAAGSVAPPDGANAPGRLEDA